MWGFGTIENQSTQALEFCYEVGTKSANGSELNATMGNATIAYGTNNFIRFTDVGHTYDKTYWGVEVQVSNQAEPVKWLYSGGGIMNVLFKANGDFELTAASYPPLTITGNFPSSTTIAYTYDSLGRVQRVVESDGNSYTYTLDKAGNIETVEYV